MSDRMNATRKAMLGEPLVNERDEFAGAFRGRAHRSKNRRRRRGRGSRRSAKGDENTDVMPGGPPYQ